MRPASAVMLAGCALAPVLWASPALAEPGYPPTGPTFGGGGVTETLGGGSVVPANLPTTGSDLMTPAVVGGSTVLLGLGLVLAGAHRSRRRGTAAPGG